MRISSGVSASVDVTDEAARALGQVSPAAGATWDVSDRITRDVGYTADRWLRELRAGRAFARHTYVPAVAGNISIIQLFNPAASPITVIVYQFVASLSVADQLQVAIHNTALTLIGTGINLLSGGAAGVGELRYAQQVASPSTPFVQTLLLATTPWSLQQPWLIELGAGEGIAMAPTSTNVGIAGAFVWMEI